MNRRAVIDLGLSATVAFIVSAIAQTPVTIRGRRWLRATSVEGYAEIRKVRREWRSLSRGDELNQAGDEAQTFDNARVVFSIDSNIGTVSTAGETRLKVRSLSITQSSARITELDVFRGNVRVVARRFSNPDSKLRIHTPAGISGIRGTDFALTVDEIGKTAVATVDGAVEVSAQGESVLVEKGYKTVTIPGEPPAEPTPFKNDPSAKIRSNIRRGIAEISGTTSPVNKVEVQGSALRVDSEGNFSARVILRPRWKNTLKVTVTTPLGRSRAYRLST